jgi:hypothetical protein
MKKIQTPENGRPVATLVRRFIQQDDDEEDGYNLTSTLSKLERDFSSSLKNS